MASSNNNGNSADFVRRLEKRLAELSTRADSIQTMSQYAIQHKNEHALVVQTWERVLKSQGADSEKRVALFYVCNDIVQNCRRKGAEVYLKTFEASLPTALVNFKEPSSLQEKVERVFKIWIERHIYPQATVDSLLSKLKSSSSSAPNNTVPSSSHAERPSAPTPSGSATTVSDAASTFSVSDIISRFKTDSLIEKLRHQATIDSDVSARNESMKNLDVDVSDVHVVSHLKNKSEGKEFCDKFERSYTALQSFVALLEKQAEARRKLVETLENAEVFYDTQYAEVKKISHVYNKYLNNVNQVMKKAAERRGSLPSPPPEEEEARTPSTIDGSESMDIETGNESASETTNFLNRSNSTGNNGNFNGNSGGNKVLIPPGPFGNFMPHPPLPLPPLPPPMMQMMPPPSSFNFVRQGMLPPPMPPRFGSPPPPNNFSPRQRSPFRSPPQQQPQMPPIPPNFAAYPHPHPPQQQQSQSPPKMAPPPAFNFPPPPMPHNQASQGTIPTVISQRSMTAPNSPMQQVRPITPLGGGGGGAFFSGAKRKRSFEGGSDDQFDPHYQRPPPANEHLIPAQPVMSLPNNFASTRPISTIVGVRRSSSSTIGSSNSDPRLAGGPGGMRGRGRGGLGRGGYNF